MWRPIETAPVGEDVLCYGSYLYPGDRNLTEYIYTASLNREGYFESCCETWHPNNFSHWMPVPDYPTEV